VRTRLDGTLEIVFDQFGVRRSIWEVTRGSMGLDGLQEACARAINADDCLATLHAALAKGGVRIVERQPPCPRATTILAGFQAAEVGVSFNVSG
jgi:hypothetical protein